MRVRCRGCDLCSCWSLGFFSEGGREEESSSSVATRDLSHRRRKYRRMVKEMAVVSMMMSLVTGSMKSWFRGPGLAFLNRVGSLGMYILGFWVDELWWGVFC